VQRDRRHEPGPAQGGLPAVEASPLTAARCSRARRSRLAATAGEFRTHVSLDGDHVGLDTVRTTVRALDTPAIVPDEETYNPCAFVLIRPDGSSERVGLQADAPDDRDEYRLLRS